MKRDQRIKANLSIAAAVLAAVAIIGLAIWWEVSVWQECRETNSWLYCWRVISR